MGCERERLQGCWSEDEVDSQFPAAAFNCENPRRRRRPFPGSATHEALLEDPDDFLSHLPSRIITDWYLVAKPRRHFGYLAPERHAFPYRRVSLPVDSQDLENFILIGNLQPQRAMQEAIKVEIDELDFYTIDTTKELRGYWIVTSHAKYWLDNPCSKVLTLPRLRLKVGGEILTAEADEGDTGVQLPSQEQLHCFHRAQLGLLSNLLDILILPDGSYNTYLQTLTLTQMDEALSPSTLDVARFHRDCTQTPNGALLLFNFAFDLDLLRSSRFLLPHIRTIHPLVEESRWFKELTQTQALGVDSSSLRTSASEEYWRSSAHKAELRSHQLPTGKQDPSRVEEVLDLLYPIELQIRYMESKKALAIATQISAPGQDDYYMLPKTSLTTLDMSERELVFVPRHTTSISKESASGAKASTKLTPLKKEPTKPTIRSLTRPLDMSKTESTSVEERPKSTADLAEHATSSTKPLLVVTPEVAETSANGSTTSGLMPTVPRKRAPSPSELIKPQASMVKKWNVAQKTRNIFSTILGPTTSDRKPRDGETNGAGKRASSSLLGTKEVESQTTQHAFSLFGIFGGQATPQESSKRLKLSSDRGAPQQSSPAGEPARSSILPRPSDEPTPTFNQKSLQIDPKAPCEPRNQGRFTKAQQRRSDSPRRPPLDQNGRLLASYQRLPNNGGSWSRYGTSINVTARGDCRIHPGHFRTFKNNKTPVWEVANDNEPRHAPNVPETRGFGSVGSADRSSPPLRPSGFGRGVAWSHNRVQRPPYATNKSHPSTYPRPPSSRCRPSHDTHFDPRDRLGYQPCWKDRQTTPTKDVLMYQDRRAATFFNGAPSDSRSSQDSESEEEGEIIDYVEDEKLLEARQGAAAGPLSFTV